MKMLVTGAEGFIGKRLLAQLSLENDNDVLGIDDEYITDDWKENLNKILQDANPDVIFHVGACSDTLEQDANYMMVRNYESTKILADWCKNKDKKIIYSSSAASYGVNGEYPSNLYGWSKYAAEDYVLHTGGIALRYFNVYGPGEQNKGKMSSFLYQAYQKAKKNQEVLLFPQKPTRDFIYIKDVVSANIHAMNTYADNKGKYYEVSTSVSSGFEEMLILAGIEYTYTSEDRIPEGYQFYTCGDSSKWMCGWSPEFSLARGVREYIGFLDDEIFQFNKLSRLHDGEKIIFCKTDYLGPEFENIRKKKNKVILMSGNSDYAVTQPVADLLPNNVHHWFCTNNLTNHPRITSIPLGLDNSFEALRSEHGVGWDHAIQKRKILSSLFCNDAGDETTGMIYANFTISTNDTWRNSIASACQDNDFITYDKHKTEYKEFISKILSHKMVVCPLGNAPQGQADNHRIYETLYCNRVPIVFSANQHKLYDSIYSKLPVVILDKYEDLHDKDKIMHIYEEVKNNPVDLIKYSFWENKVLQKAKEI